MTKYYAILNNNTSAPGSSISEDDDLHFDLVEGTEEEIHEEAYKQNANRVHLYEITTDDFDQDSYKYVTTQASKHSV